MALRLLLGAGGTLVALLVLAAALFVVGVPLPGEWVRPSLERVLTDAFGATTRIEGPLLIRTGLTATASASGLTLVDPFDPGAPPLARATRPSARIDLIALLRGAVKLDDIAAERLEARLARGADGRGNWEPLFVTSDTPARVAFAGIGLLKISKLNGSYAGQPGEEPTRWELNGLESSFRGRDPITAQGTLLIAERTLAFKVSSVSLAEMIEGPPKVVPVKAAVESSGARISVDGAYEPATAVLEAQFEIAAANGGEPLAALGVAAQKSGPLDARGKVRVSAHEAVVDELALQLGKTSASGKFRVNWSASRPFVSLDMTATRVDENPFLAGAGRVQGKTKFEEFVQLIHDITSSIDLHAKLSVRNFVGMVTDLRDYTLEARIDDRVLTSRTSSDILGMKTNLRLDYSARAPKRVLTMRVDGKRFSTEKLPGGVRPSAVSATIGELRGELRGSGLNTQEVVGSAYVNLDMRDLRLTWSRAGKRPEVVRFESGRFEIARGGAANGRIQGWHRGKPCSANVAGGTLPSLIAGERWPLRLTVACASATLAAKGHVVVKPPRTTGEFDFTGRTNRLGTLPELLGLATSVPQSAAVEGHLALGESNVRVRMAKLNVGRTRGSGQVSWPLASIDRARISLALKVLDIDELSGSISNKPRQSTKDLLEREILPSNLELPELDLELSADVARLKGESLTRLRIQAAPSKGRLPPAPFAFEWRKSAVSGKFSADLRSKRPSVALSGSAQGADLDALLTDVDLTKVGFHAGAITLDAKAGGVRVGELLSSATVDAALDDGKVADIRRLLPGLSGTGEFSATLKVAEGKPATLAARGSAGNMPFDFVIETGRLTELVRMGNTLPAKLRLTLGENELQASGKVGSGGTADFRATLSGKRLSELGRLAALQLPPVSPYSVSADLKFAPDSIQVSDFDAKFGKSRLLGTFNVNLAGEKPFHSADLRAPHLHLEDLGLDSLIGGTGKSTGSTVDAAASRAVEEKRIAQVKDILNGFNAKVSLGVDTLHSEGKPYAKLKGGLTLKGGDLHVTLRDVEAAGGSGSADFNLDASRPRPRFRWRVLAKGFEYRPLAKAIDPQTALEGTADLSFDVTTGRFLAPLLADADGQFDAAVYPRGQRLGAADYWGTGLFYFVQRKIDPASESRLNCVVGLFDIKDGLARSEALFADTTRVRIIGNVEANLETGELSGKMSPRAKNPALFTVDPSVDISGTLESPQITVAPVSFLTTPLQFILPLHSYALNWLNSTDAPANGSDGCRQAFTQAISADKTKPQPPPDSSRGPWPF